MKQLFFFTLVSLIILNIGCSKNSGTQPNNPPDVSLKVKTITQDITGSYMMHSTTTLSYDSQDRLTRVESDSSHITFEYNNNLIKKSLYQNNSATQYFYYYFNNSNRIDSSVVTLEGVSFIGTSIPVYNSKNNVIYTVSKTTNPFGTTVDTTFNEYNSRGDLVKITNGLNVNSYEYSDTIGIFNSAFEINPGALQQPHRTKSSKFIYSGREQSNASLNYVYDEKGRIKTIIVLDKSAFGSAYDNTSTSTYTYY